MKTYFINFIIKIFENFFASGLAKNNILDAIFNSRYNNSIYNVSSMGISDALRAGNFNEMLGFIDDKLSLLGVFVVDCKLAAKEFKRCTRWMNRKCIVVKDNRIVVRWWIVSCKYRFRRIDLDVSHVIQ